MFHRRSKYAFDRPTTAQATANRETGNSSGFAPVGYAHRFTVMCQQAVVSRIATLLRTCGPAAIRWLVVAVVVKSVKRMVIGAWPHVTPKRFERLPAWAHYYAACAIKTVLGVLWIGTTLSHLLPHLVFRQRRYPSRIVCSHVPSPSCIRNVVRAASRLAPTGCLYYTHISNDWIVVFYL